ncbi:MAG: hypothetical protein AAGA96_16595 [Verrucomicrobiota bacterium]
MKAKPGVGLIAFFLVALTVLLWWASPKITPITENFSLIHYRGSKGQTYIINKRGMKLTGPVIADLEVTSEAIFGRSGTEGNVPFVIDRRTGLIEYPSISTR